MRVIPVLDIRHGQAVRAIAGNREHYGPLRSVLHPGTDPLTLARAAIERWKLPDLYLADLDAILGEAPPRFELYRSLADLGLTLWIDPGVRNPAEIPRLIDAGVERVIVGLETVSGPTVLRQILEVAGSERVVFSLDMKQGRPLVDTRASWGTDEIEAIAARAIDLGIRRMIRLDLARVGTGQGVGDLPESLPEGAEWFVGGGISASEEIARLQVAGVLIGSALHDGRITHDDLISYQ